jgi:hypothetical protein
MSAAPTSCETHHAQHSHSRQIDIRGKLYSPFYLSHNRLPPHHKDISNTNLPADFAVNFLQLRSTPKVLSLLSSLQHQASSKSLSTTPTKPSNGLAESSGQQALPVTYLEASIIQDAIVGGEGTRRTPSTMLSFTGLTLRLKEPQAHVSKTTQCLPANSQLTCHSTTGQRLSSS